MITPLYQVFYKYKDQVKSIYVKDESKNESGSIKIRPAKLIIQKAYEEKEITSSTPICEVTSGNMGIALAYALKNYKNKLIICMPKFMSKERVKILKDLGVKLILTSSFEEAFKIASDMEKNGIYLTKQFENINNAKSYKSIIDEISDYIYDINAFVVGVGTGGTINGIGSILKKDYAKKIIAIEPLQTLILSTGISHGPHRIEGLSDGFVPKLYPKEIVDEIISVDDNDAICMAQKLKSELGLNVGISSGANFMGAILSNIDKALTIFPDDDSKYYSTDLSNKNLNSKIVDDIELLYYKIIN